MRYNTELSFCIAEGGLLKLKGAGRVYPWESGLGINRRSFSLGFFLLEEVFVLNGLLHGWLTRPISLIILCGKQREEVRSY